MNKKILFGAIGACAAVTLAAAAFIGLKGRMMMNIDKGVVVKLGDTKVDLTADIHDIIATINNNNSVAMNVIGYEALYLDEAGNIYTEPGTSVNFEEKSRMVQLSYDKAFGNTDIEKELHIPGCSMFCFVEGDSDLCRCDGFSVFPDWNGDMSRVNEYINNTNSYEKGDVVIALFKNGKIINVEDIIEEYSDYSFDMQKIPYRYFWGNQIQVDVSEDQYPFVAALIDWGRQYMDGEIDNCGCIKWFPENKEIDICVACSYEDCRAFLNREKR